MKPLRNICLATVQANPNENESKFCIVICPAQCNKVEFVINPQYVSLYGLILSSTCNLSLRNCPKGWNVNCFQFLCVHP